MPEHWRHREPAVTRNGNVRMYWLHCQRCFAPKGRTLRRFCLNCRRKEPRVVGVELRCREGHVLKRNDVIRGLYFAGVTSPLLGQVFELSANQILQIVKRSPDEHQ